MWYLDPSKTDMLKPNPQSVGVWVSGGLEVILYYGGGTLVN